MKKIINLNKDKRGIFGLTAVQQFFAIILSIALLAYVIVTIMGTLSNANIVPLNTVAMSGSVANETLTSVTEDLHYVSKSTLPNFDMTVCITCVLNATNNVVIPAADWGYTGPGGVRVTNSTSIFNNTNWKVSYTYTYTADSPQVANANSILGNVSTGITGFFGAINPVYAILAILVIILVLVVLVRVVQAPNGINESASL